MATNPDFEQAVRDNAVSMVRVFLREGESPDEYVFSLAIRYNANAVLRVLIKAGANLNAVEHPKSSGCTPLMRAILMKNIRVFRLLLKAGALINKQGTWGSPLHAAAHEGSVAFTRACLAAGATIDMRALITGNTPLMTAAHFGHANVVRLLLKAGANSRLRDPFGRTACEIAADSEKAEIFELLKELSVRKKKR